MLDTQLVYYWLIDRRCKTRNGMVVVTLDGAFDVDCCSRLDGWISFDLPERLILSFCVVDLPRCLSRSDRTTIGQQKIEWSAIPINRRVNLPSMSVAKWNWAATFRPARPLPHGSNGDAIVAIYRRQPPKLGTTNWSWLTSSPTTPDFTFARPLTNRGWRQRLPSLWSYKVSRHLHQSLIFHSNRIVSIFI